MSNKIIMPYGKKIVYEELAKIWLKQNSEPLTKENIAEVVWELADESMESYIPDPILGQNPESRISKNIQSVLSLDLGPQKKIFNKLKNDPASYDKAVKEMMSAVTELTNVVLKNFYGMKISRSSKPDPDNMSTYTDFEQMPITKDQIIPKEKVQQRNYQALVNVMIRHNLASYILSSLYPWIDMNIKDLYKIYYQGGLDKMSAKNFYKPNVLKQITLGVAKRYWMAFAGNLIVPTKNLVIKNFKIENFFSKDWILESLRIKRP